MGELEICVQEELYSKASPLCALHHSWDPYTNSCVPVFIIQFTDQENENAMAIVYGCILPVLSLIVLISHLIVVWVLYEQKSFQKRASVEPLLWMAISAVFMAISPLPFTIYYYNLGHMEDTNQSDFLCNLQKISMEILPFFFNTLITLFTLLLGVQRFVAIQFPLDSFRWCTRKKIRMYSKLIILMAFLLSAIHYSFDVRHIYHMCIKINESMVETETGELTPVSQSFWVARCFVGYSTITQIVGGSFLADVFDIIRICIALVPSVMLFIITILLIRAVKTNDKTFSISDDSRQISTINRHKKINKASRNTTVMLTVIIILFLVGRLPSTILIVMVHFSSYFTSTQDSASVNFLHDVYLRACANIIMMTVHPISFAVYMLMSRRFRVSLRKLLGIRCLASDEEMRTAKLLSSTTTITFRNNKESKTPLISTRMDSHYSFSCRPSLRNGCGGVRFQDGEGYQKTSYLHPESGNFRVPPRSQTNPENVSQLLSDQ